MRLGRQIIEITMVLWSKLRYRENVASLARGFTLALISTYLAVAVGCIPLRSSIGNLALPQSPNAVCRGGEA